MQNFLVSIIIIISWGLSAQKNSFEPSLSYQYSNKKGIHARSIEIKDNTLFLGTNLGDLFSFDLLTQQANHFEHRSFKELRDMIVLDKVLYVLSAGDTSTLIRYSLESRDVEFTQIFPGVFLNGMDRDSNEIFVMGDPVSNHFSLYKGFLDRNLFNPIPSIGSLKGEAGFAASGSTVWYKNGVKSFYSGGSRSCLYIQTDSTWNKYPIPSTPCETCGIYSSFHSAKRWFAVGGNFLQKDLAQDNFFYSDDKGKTWKKSKKGPSGYRSTIVAQGKYVYCGGTNGIDFSKNNGKTWKKVSDKSCYSMKIWNNKLICSGVNGTIDIYDLTK